MRAAGRQDFSTYFAIAPLLVAVAGGCLGLRARPNEVNLAFSLSLNQPILTNVRIEGHPGRFVLATAIPKTLLGRRFVAAKGLDRLGPFNGTLGDTRAFRIDANVLDLEGEMDGMVGADLLGPVVSIDYRHQIAAISRDFLDRSDMVVFAYPGTLPSIPLIVDGKGRSAIVDTAVPDTLVVPSSWFPDSASDRALTTVELAGVRFENVDVAVSPVPEARIGNRLLAHFTLVVDYRGRRVALWARSR